jgi:hypothetical protein
MRGCPLHRAVEIKVLDTKNEAHMAEYLKSGEYLPPELRDFHDAKLFFKWLVWNVMENAKKSGKGDAMMLEGLNFANCQIFTIDYFLWFMAKFGYKLQRIRKSGLEFYDLSGTMDEYRKQLTNDFHAALSEHLKSSPPASAGSEATDSPA